MPFWTSGSQSFTDTLAAAMLVSPCWKSVKFEPRSEIELHRAVHVFLQDLACPGWGVQPVVCPMGAMLVLYPHAVWSLMALTYVIEWRHVSFPLVINSRFQLQTSDPLKPDETWSVFPLPSTGQNPVPSLIFATSANATFGASQQCGGVSQVWSGLLGAMLVPVYILLCIFQPNRLIGTHERVSKTIKK